MLFKPDEKRRTKGADHQQLPNDGEEGPHPYPAASSDHRGTQGGVGEPEHDEGEGGDGTAGGTATPSDGG